MPSFSKTSLDRLNTCHPDLVRLFTEVIRHFDCTVLEGHRDEAAQHKAFITGNSKLDWPHGKHNATPSLAIDVAPWPVDWNNRERFILFAGRVEGIASQLGIAIRWGGDWDGQSDPKSNSFSDLPHFELLKP